FVTIDRDTAGRLGVTPAAIDNALYNAFGQRLISTIFTQANQYRVVLEVKPEYRRGLAAFDDIYVSGSNSALAQGTNSGQAQGTSSTQAQTRSRGQVPLTAVASISERPTALSINHNGQFPATTVSFNLAPGSSLGAAVDAIEKAEKDLGLPASVRTSFQGA